MQWSSRERAMPTHLWPNPKNRDFRSERAICLAIFDCSAMQRLSDVLRDGKNLEDFERWMDLMTGESQMRVVMGEGNAVVNALRA